jgi:hypothetical protein
MDLVEVVLISILPNVQITKLVEVVQNKHLQGMAPSYVWKYGK